jgi:hypothetical protein
MSAGKDGADREFLCLMVVQDRSQCPRRELWRDEPRWDMGDAEMLEHRRAQLFAVAGAEPAFGLMLHLGTVVAGEEPWAHLPATREGDATVLVEVGRLRRRAVSFKIMGRGDRHEGIGGKTARGQGRVDEVAMTNGKIDPVLDQIDDAIRRQHLDADPRIRFKKLRQTRHYIKPSKDRSDRYVNKARWSARIVAEQGLKGGKILRKPNRAVVEGLSRVGDREAS